LNELLVDGLDELGLVETEIVRQEALGVLGS
jgi:hypothetical protein